MAEKMINRNDVHIVAPDTMNVLDTMVLGIRFCLNLEQITKVLPLVALQVVPQAPNYMKGMMNLAGEGVPVIDLAQRLGLTNTQPYSLNTPIILCNVEDKLAGLIVQEVRGVASVQLNGMQIDELFQGDISLIEGVVNVEGILSMLLDLRRVLEINMPGGKAGSQFTYATHTAKGQSS